MMIRRSVGAMVVAAGIAPAALAVPINEPNFLGNFGDTVAFSSSPLAIGLGFDDQNPLTVADMVAGYTWSIDGFEISGASFALAFVDPDYLSAFPTVGVYTLQFIYEIDALDSVSFEPVSVRFVAETRTITLVPTPGALALLPVGAAFAMRRRSRA